MWTSPPAAIGLYPTLPTEATDLIRKCDEEKNSGLVMLGFYLYEEGVLCSVTPPGLPSSFLFCFHLYD